AFPARRASPPASELASSGPRLHLPLPARASERARRRGARPLPAAEPTSVSAMAEQTYS
ncbi:Hypothetical predicted protein, partial [Marmota monax]